MQRRNEGRAMERSYDVTVTMQYTLRVQAPDEEEARRIALIAADFANQCVRWDELRQWQEIRPAGLVVDPARAEVHLSPSEGRLGA
jgi:hypothetical protein